MKRIHFVAAALLALVFAGTLAVAQIVAPTIVSIINPGDLVQVIPNGIAGSVSVYAKPSQLTAQSGYVKAIPVTTNSYTFANNQTFLQLAPAGTLATLYTTLAPGPSDGARNCTFTTQTLTAFYVAANSGQSINNAATSLSANTGVCYLYSLSNNTWDRD